MTKWNRFSSRPWRTTSRCTTTPSRPTPPTCSPSGRRWTSTWRETLQKIFNRGLRFDRSRETMVKWIECKLVVPLQHRDRGIHMERVCAGMQAIISLTSAFVKLGHLFKQDIVCLYQCAQLNQLMWNNNGSNQGRVIIACMQWHALSTCILRSLFSAPEFDSRNIQMPFFLGIRCFERNAASHHKSAWSLEKTLSLRARTTCGRSRWRGILGLAIYGETLCRGKVCELKKFDFSVTVEMHQKLPFIIKLFTNSAPSLGLFIASIYV